MTTCLLCGSTEGVKRFPYIVSGADPILLHDGRELPAHTMQLEVDICAACLKKAEDMEHLANQRRFPNEFPFTVEQERWLKERARTVPE